MFRRIKALHTALGIRTQTIKIVQIPANAKLSKADRIKKLNFENKYLFGATLNKKKVKAAEATSADVDAQPSEEVKNPKDIKSEIYWTCHHVPEVQDFTKPKKKAKSEPKTKKAATSKTAKPKEAKKSKVEDSNVQSEVVPALEKVKKKKATVAKEPAIPIKDDSASFPLAVKISRSLLSKNEQIDPDSESSADEREIPFKSDQLRAILNFPMSLSSSKVISSFDKFALEVPSIQLPSVSKVLQATMPENQRQALMQWKSKKIAELGLEGFEIMQKSHLSRGKLFHECLQSHFRGEQIIKSEISSEVIEIWNSIEPLLDSFQAPGVLIEEKIQHPYLHYQGIVDCVSYHDSNLCVIEWKKSDRQKKQLSYTYDAPVQLCSYLGALNASREEFRENPIKGGVVVVAYHDGQRADLFELKEKELGKYWRVWLQRLQEYWIRYKDNTLPEKI